MRLRIDRASAAPPYEQVVVQVRRQIERGTLAPGTRLPTVRALAERSGLVPNTVAKAYRELAAQGWLDARGRAGTFVADGPPGGEAAERVLATAAATFVERARQLGVDDTRALAAVRRAQQP